jgi:hypothetical protein
MTVEEWRAKNPRPSTRPVPRKSAPATPQVDLTGATRQITARGRQGINLRRRKLDRKRQNASYRNVRRRHARQPRLWPLVLDPNDTNRKRAGRYAVLGVYRTVDKATRHRAGPVAAHFLRRPVTMLVGRYARLQIVDTYTSAGVLNVSAIQAPPTNQDRSTACVIQLYQNL